MNILMVYQSVVDMCASFFTLVTAVFQVDGTSMSRSLHDRFVCHIWLGRLPLYWLMNTSTYGILFTAFDRYAAVIYPIWYNNNVRTVSLADGIGSVIVDPVTRLKLSIGLIRGPPRVGSGAVRIGPLRFLTGGSESHTKSGLRLFC